MKATKLHILGLGALALATAAFAGPSVANAQAKRLDELRYPPLNKIEIRPPQRVDLPNGLTVLLIEDRELPLVSAVAIVDAGSIRDPAAKVGLSALGAEVLRSGGAGSRQPDTLDDDLEAKAASIETGAARDYVYVSMDCLAEDLGSLFPVFADVLRRPLFAEDRLGLAKNQQFAFVARQNDNASGILFRELTEIIYGDTSPLAVTPTFASLAAVTRDDLLAWHGEHFHPNHMVIGLVGDFERAGALEVVRKALGDWKKGPARHPIVADVGKGPAPGIRFAEKSDLTQSSIGMGYLGIRRSDPDYFAVELMNQVLSGSFGARLFSNVRTKKGLAYNVNGQVGAAYAYPGMTMVTMSTKVETTGAGIEALLAELTDMVSAPPTQEEVEKAKASILNSFVFNSDTPDEILFQQLTYAFYGYPADWLARYRRGIEATTVEQVRDAAKRHLRPKDLAIFVVGPGKGQDRPLSDFGPVSPRDISIPRPSGPGLSQPSADGQR